MLMREKYHVLNRTFWAEQKVGGIFVENWSKFHSNIFRGFPHESHVLMRQSLSIL